MLPYLVTDEFTNSYMFYIPIFNILELYFLLMRFFITTMLLGYQKAKVYRALVWTQTTDFLFH